ncbi:hypothetical protein LguiB_029287 [Lonicera macranthoides]
MAERTAYITIQAVIVTILIFVPIVFSDDAAPIPADNSQIEAWFTANVGAVNTRKDTLDPPLVTAEAGSKVIKVNADGSGEFKTVMDAINSIPTGNTNRVIISIGPGNYTEKIRIDRDKPFITFYGAPDKMPTLVFDGDAAKYGTVDSASLIVESNYFSAVNINIVNSSPRPDGKRKGAQAVALRIGGDKASFYNCKLYGFQDTLCDDKGLHFYKDCYIEGTVDFIFGDAKSLYVNTELHVIEGDPMAMITAQARKSEGADTGYSFVQCKITGTGGFAHLGRAWMQYAKVIFANTEMGDAVKAEGWSNNNNPANDNTVFFGEFNNTGPGANPSARAPYTKKLTDAEAKDFMSLAFIQGSKWLLPPVKV